MGTPVEDIVLGPNCGHWEPVDETPKNMYCFFFDLLKGDKAGAVQPPNLHLFRMQQIEAGPCIWRTENPAFGFGAEYGLIANNSWLWLYNFAVPRGYYFFDNRAVSPPTEYLVFTNEQQAEWGNWGYAGFGIIFWMEHVLELAEEFRLLGAGDLMMEIFPAEAMRLVVKFCSLTLRTNVSMKFSI